MIIRPTHLLAMLLSAGLLAALPATARERGPGLRPVANPSAVIARELAFAQSAQEQGQWTAFAAFAAPDAVMFVPEMVLAQGWLKGRANPPQAVKWQATDIWSSCDGSLAVSHGQWQGVGDSGWFTTIWQRQADGTYLWLLDHGDSQKDLPALPEMATGRVADCPEHRTTPQSTPQPLKAQRSAARQAAPAFDPLARSGQSHDGTLDWKVTVSPAGARKLIVSWLKDGKRQVVRDETVTEPPAEKQ